MTTVPEHAADMEQLKRALAVIQTMRERISAYEAERREPIAIVGIGCRLPGGSTSPAQFWEFLRRGGDAVIEVPPDRWDIDAYYSDDPEAVGKLPTRRAAFIRDIDQFDPAFFGISPREANAMDPQQRLLLESMWEALEDAGIPPGQLAGSRTGVFIGIGINDYGRLQVSDQQQDPTLIDTYTATGNHFCISANRISYLLDLRGPSMAIDSACSSSLVAVHHAVQSLRRGESDLALVGGSNLLLAPETGISVGRFLSPTGVCRFGDAGADGYVRGEGAVMIAMKTLTRAMADGDNIYAVIRGSAVNQDGFSSGLTVPNGFAQQAMLRDALRDAGVEPHEIAYVEAHGTGTALGDPIEIRSLGKVLGTVPERSLPLLVGSVKTNVGHLEAGAGIVGLLKVALSLANGAIPPSLNYSRPNENIPYDELGVRVQTEVTPWPEGRRLAGVSGFGFGGTNAHVVLEAAPEPQQITSDTDAVAPVLVLSAKDPQGLNDLAQRYSNWLDEHPDVSLDDLCYSAATTRTHLEHRLALPAASIDALRGMLESQADGVLPAGASVGQVTAGERRKVAFLFTGQGAQFAGMGKRLYDSEPVFNRTLDRCAELLASELETSLLDVIFAAPGSPEAALLDRTEYTQPALFALEYALAELWLSWGVRPDAVTGHSIGEYVAACVAGVFSLEDGLRLVAARGRLMGRLPSGGAMAAIFAAEDAVLDSLGPYAGQVGIAAINEPGQVVISGAEEAVDQITSSFAERGVRTRRLTVSHAFHSPLMDPILDEFEALARSVVFHSPTIPLIANLTGEPWQPGATPDARYWRRHLREAVQFMKGLQSLDQMAIDLFVEVGPGATLSGMGQATLPDDRTFLPSIRSSDERQLAKTLGALYVHGIAIDWHALFGSVLRRRLRLPTYPWQRGRYWFQQRQSAAAVVNTAVNRLHPLIDRRLRSPNLSDIVFESTLNRASLPYLADHRVYDRIVVPAAAIVELVIAAATLLDDRRYEVGELTISEPLALPDDGSRLVQVLLERSSQNLQFRVVSTSDDDTWYQHATGCVEALRQTEPTDQPADPMVRYSQVLDISALYDRFTTLGMGFGPAFHTLTYVSRDERAAFGEIELQHAAGSSEAYLFHPTLFDACLQVAAVMMPVGEDVIYLPVSLEHVQILARPGRRIYCHARALPTRDDATLACEAEVFDADGRLVARVGQVTFRRATPHAIATAIGRQDDIADALYEVEWRQLPDTTSELPAGPGCWLVFAGADPTIDALGRTLSERGAQVEIVRMGSGRSRLDEHLWEIDPADPAAFQWLLNEAVGGEQLHGVVYSWGIEGCTGSISFGLQGALHLSQALADREATRIWFVTRGAQAAGGYTAAPEQAALWGFARSLNREHPSLRPVCIDLDPCVSDDDCTRLLVELGATDDEREVALHAGTRYVARLVPHRRTQVGQPSRLEITERGSIDDVTLTRRPVDRIPPAPDEVEIEVRATGLNFRDVLNVLGLYPEPVGAPGSECSGVISAVGRDVTSFRVGDPVMALADGTFSSYVTVPADLVAPMPRGCSFAEAATVPIAFVTAAYSLRHLAGIAAGTRVLIHAATGGVGLAALQIARAAGAEVFATAGSDAKRAYLRSLGVEYVYDSRSTGFAEQVRAATNGVGVDVVLNSLTGELIPESFASLRDGGCFLEIGKRGIWSTNEVAALGRDIDYHPIYLGGEIERDPLTFGGMLRDISHELAAGTLQPLPLRTYPVDRVTDAFRYLAQTRHIGKVVVTQSPQPTPPAKATIRPDASYLVTGGLGGVGLEVARWLVSQGARAIALNGRSEPGAAARQAIAELEETGATVLTLQGDIGRFADVERILEAIDAQLPPLAGVVHAAGFVDDGVVTQLSWSRFEGVFGPKVAGAWNLQQATLEHALDFFVLFSAGATLVGAPGQSNYVAANAALDALAAWRQSRGLPAVSINWGPWSEVGMAASLGDEHRQRLAEQGFRSLSTDQALRGLASALSQRVAQIAVMPFDWDRFARVFAPDSPPSLFREVAVPVQADSAGTQPTNGAGIERIAALPPSLRRNAMLREVRERAAHVLGQPDPEALQVARPLSELGMDSLMAVELRNVLGRSLQSALPATLLFEYPTIESLTDYLLGMLPGGAQVTESVNVASNHAINDEIDVAELTDDEAEALLALELSSR